MRTRIGATLVLLAFTGVLGFVVVPTLTPAQDKTKLVTVHTKWEYKIVKIPATVPVVNPPLGPIVPPPFVGGTVGATPGTMTEAQLTSLGEQGWELVSVTGGQPYVKSTQVGTAGIGPPIPPPMVNTTGFTDTVYYFKRPK